MKVKGNSGISKHLETEILLSMVLHRQMSLHVWVGDGGERESWVVWESLLEKPTKAARAALWDGGKASKSFHSSWPREPLYWENTNIYCGWEHSCCGQENNNLSILMNKSLQNNQSKKNAGLKPQVLQLFGVIYKTLISGWLFGLRIACNVPT